MDLGGQQVMDITSHGVDQEECMTQMEKTKLYKIEEILEVIRRALEVEAALEGVLEGMEVE